MSAVERGFYSHAGRILSRLENVHNTGPVRKEALRIIKSGVLSTESQLHGQLLVDIEKGWRREKEVQDLELDTLKV